MNNTIIPRTYQISSANSVSGSGILAHSMGSGKTVTALLWAEEKYTSLSQKVFILVPTKHVKTQWIHTIRKLKIEQKYMLCYTYKEVENKPGFNPSIVIMDEAHNLCRWKYERQNRIDEVERIILQAAHKLLVTATPYWKNEDDLRFLLYYIDPTVFPNNLVKYREMFYETRKFISFVRGYVLPFWYNPALRKIIVTWFDVKMALSAIKQFKLVRKARQSNFAWFVEFQKFTGRMNPLTFKKYGNAYADYVLLKTQYDLNPLVPGRLEFILKGQQKRLDKMWKNNPARAAQETKQLMRKVGKFSYKKLLFTIAPIILFILGRLAYVKWRPRYRQMNKRKFRRYVRDIISVYSVQPMKYTRGNNWIKEPVLYYPLVHYQEVSVPYTDSDMLLFLQATEHDLTTNVVEKLELEMAATLSLEEYLKKAKQIGHQSRVNAARQRIESMQNYDKHVVWSEAEIKGGTFHSDVKVLKPNEYEGSDFPEKTFMHIVDVPNVFVAYIQLMGRIVRNDIRYTDRPCTIFQYFSSTQSIWSSIRRAKIPLELSRWFRTQPWVIFTERETKFRQDVSPDAILLTKYHNIQRQMNAIHS